MKPPDYSALELLERLVAFDTTSHKSNLALIRFVEDYLAHCKVASRLVLSPDGEKANLFATIGPEGVAGVALSGHTDVVPVDGQDWDADPFRLRDLGDRVAGRGTTDMKGFLACVLAAVPEFQAQPLKTPIHIAFSYDEEIGCVGVRPMIAEFGLGLTKPRMVIVGEPTNMGVVDAHKGSRGGRSIRAWRIWASMRSRPPGCCWANSPASRPRSCPRPIPASIRRMQASR
jgi:acetylornithine deacetylase